MSDDSQELQVAGWRRRITWLVLGCAMVWQAVYQLGPIVVWNGWVPDVKSWGLVDWWVEDAAISFAYARNWAAGEGLVVFPGGERIEAYSNPLWVALLAPFYLVGLDGFVGSKVLAAVLGVGTVWMTWRIAVEAIGEETPTALVAPVVLACMPTFAIWNASGLENPLFSFCLAGGIWRTGVESRRGGFPYAAFFYLGLAITRPEAIMYGALGGFVAMVASFAQGRGVKPTLTWLAAFFVPFVGYHLIRYGYFAWTFPNTYYAKLGERSFAPFNWTSRGWRTIREWGGQTGLAWGLPLYVAGLLGLAGWRGVWAALGAAVFIFAWLHPDAAVLQDWSWWPMNARIPDNWTEVRIVLLAVLGAGLPVLAAGREGGVVRSLAWGSAVLAFFFCVRADGDWMKGYRWMSFVVVPAAVLLAAGVHEVIRAVTASVATRPRLVLTADVLAALVAAVWMGSAGWEHGQWFFGKRETSPQTVKLRADYTHELMERVFVRDIVVRNLEVDQGAHLYWSPHHMIDMAGLVDLPVAHLGWRYGRFTSDYIFREMRPHVAHIHKHWARKTRITNNPEWSRQWLEVPGYPEKATYYHRGMHVRRDLVFDPMWMGSKGRGFTTAALRFDGFEVPAGVAASGEHVFIEVGLARTDRVFPGTRLLAFLSNEAGVAQVFEMPLAYGWLPVENWRTGEVFHGRFAMPVPDVAQRTAFDLGFVLLDERGRVLAVTGTQGQGTVHSEDAVFARGEVRFAGAVVVDVTDAVAEASQRARLDAIAQADADGCTGAEAAWARAWQHHPADRAAYDAHRPDVARAIAGCWIRKAADATPVLAATWLERARVFDHRHPELFTVQDAVGSALHADGEKARSDGAVDLAYQAFAAAVRADPSRAWSRRAAEEMRALRLGVRVPD